MRFKVTQSNIEIDPSPEGAESVLLALVGVLVPRWTSRVWFTSRQKKRYQVLEERSREGDDLRILDYDHNTDHILDKFRIIEGEDGTIFVAEALHLTIKDRKQICESLIARLGK